LHVNLGIKVKKFLIRSKKERFFSFASKINPKIPFTNSFYKDQKSTFEGGYVIMA